MTEYHDYSEVYVALQRSLTDFYNTLVNKKDVHRAGIIAAEITQLGYKLRDLTIQIQPAPKDGFFSIDFLKSESKVLRRTIPVDAKTLAEASKIAESILADPEPKFWECDSVETLEEEQDYDFNVYFIDNSGK